MGPFVLDLIYDQLNLVVALLLGIGFGFVLKQAGFSSSRRLAGVFYGYDFTVLRVFFTAAVTAMSGVLLLGYFGLLDTEAIYVNPTWLVPAIVAGQLWVSGLSFAYCPGTSTLPPSARLMECSCRRRNTWSCLLSASSIRCIISFTNPIARPD